MLRDKGVRGTGRSTCFVPVGASNRSSRLPTSRSFSTSWIETPPREIRRRPFCGHVGAAVPFKECRCLPIAVNIAGRVRRDIDGGGAPAARLEGESMKLVPVIGIGLLAGLGAAGAALAADATAGAALAIGACWLL